ncbi:1 YbbK [Pectobacterium sp. F1-1]|nr:1 YbbK [Pectobacterium sp. F1-1]
MSNILISACLSGFPVRYNGTKKKSIDDYLTQWRQQARLITFCPELAAGFPTPSLRRKLSRPLAALQSSRLALRLSKQPAAM